MVQREQTVSRMGNKSSKAGAVFNVEEIIPIS